MPTCKWPRCRNLAHGNFNGEWLCIDHAFYGDERGPSLADYVLKGIPQMETER